MAAGLLLVVGILGGLKFLQISSLMAYGAEAEAAGQPPEAVAVAVAGSQQWETTIEAVGSIAGLDSVAIRNELPGMVMRIAFDSGAMVKENDLLVELDAREERAQLEAARARRDLAEKTLNRATRLVQQGAFPQAELDDARATYHVAEHEVGTLQAQLSKKIIRAPFAGRLGIREISLGQYLEPGTRITVLDSLGEAFVDFTLPQEQLPLVSEGMPVRVSLERGGGAATEGSIVAVAPTVNAATRSVELRARLPEQAKGLRAGMFVDVSVVRPEKRQVIAVPATAVIHASYGDSVFVVTEKEPGSPGMAQTPDGRMVQIARQQFVRLGPSRGDFVAIEEGLEPGQTVVTAGAFKLRNGSPVVVDPNVPIEPEIAPRPENR